MGKRIKDNRLAPAPRTMVLETERKKMGSLSTRLQFASVHGSFIWKNPKTFIKVPASKKHNGTSVRTAVTRKTNVKAGYLHTPNRVRWEIGRASWRERV